MFGSCFRAACRLCPGENRGFIIRVDDTEGIIVRGGGVAGSRRRRIVSAKLFVKVYPEERLASGSTLDVSPNTLTDDSFAARGSLPGSIGEVQARAVFTVVSFSRSLRKSSYLPFTVCMKTFHEDSFASTFGITKDRLNGSARKQQVV